MVQNFEYLFDFINKEIYSSLNLNMHSLLLTILIHV
jgi:hypothetical protein